MPAVWPPQQGDLFTDSPLPTYDMDARTSVLGTSTLDDDCSELLISIQELPISGLCIRSKALGEWEAELFVNASNNRAEKMLLRVFGATSLRGALRELLLCTQLYVSTKSIHSRREQD